MNVGDIGTLDAPVHDPASGRQRRREGSAHRPRTAATSSASSASAGSSAARTAGTASAQRLVGERPQLVGPHVPHRGAGARAGAAPTPPGRAAATSGSRPAARSGAQHRQEPDRQLLRAVGGDLRERVPDPRVGEPLEQRGAVRRDVVRPAGQVRAQTSHHCSSQGAAVRRPPTASSTVACPRSAPT